MAWKAGIWHCRLHRPSSHYTFPSLRPPSCPFLLPSLDTHMEVRLNISIGRGIATVSTKPMPHHASSSLLCMPYNRQKKKTHKRVHILKSREGHVGSWLMELYGDRQETQLRGRMTLFLAWRLPHFQGRSFAVASPLIGNGHVWLQAHTKTPAVLFFT